MAKSFFYRQEKKFNGEVRQTTPIEDTPNITDLSSPQINNTTHKDDFDYIESYKAKNNGRMKWEICYTQGKNEGFFTGYSKSSTLKSAYHNKRTASRKRRRPEISE
jgi:hypothetical protein